VAAAPCHQGIAMHPRMGAKLPGKAILPEMTGAVDVSAIDPVTAMQAIRNIDPHATTGRACNRPAKAAGI
jgi:hypothetical protein